MGGGANTGPTMVMVQTAFDPAKLSCPPGFDPRAAANTTYQGKTYYFSSIEDRDKFLHAFIEHLSTYALRLVLTVDDREQITSLVEEAKKNRYGLKDIVRAVALSDLIRKR